MEQALYASSHSKHVLIGKPISRTLAEGRRMIDRAAEAGTTLMVSEPVRYLETVETCKQFIVDGAVERVRTLTVHSEHYSPLESWRIEADLRRGGELMDSGIHFVDIFLDIGGFPESVYAIETPESFH